MSKKNNIFQYLPEMKLKGFSFLIHAVIATTAPYSLISSASTKRWDFTGPLSVGGEPDSTGDTGTNTHCGTPFYSVLHHILIFMNGFLSEH